MEKARLNVWAQPGASRDRIAGLHGGRLKVAVSAPPEKGRANKAVEAVIAGALGVRKTAVKVVTGETSREKTVEVEGVDEARARALLGLPAASEPGRAR